MKDNNQYENEISTLKAKLDDNLKKFTLVNEKKEDLVKMKGELNSKIDLLQKEKTKFNSFILLLFNRGLFKLD